MPHHHHRHHHQSRHHSENFPSSRVSGHKRERDYSDYNDGTGGYVKLFVGSVPRTATEEQVRSLFEEYGDVLEVAIIKDKRTGLQQGCCFVKYSSRDEADRAIRCLNNQRALPGGSSCVQVRYADGERERLGAVEHKLFVGCLNKQANEKEIEEVFSPYGRVDDVYIMRDEHKQSRGCAFIKFPSRDMALQAISALNNMYIMRGCDQPLAVRFADPKRPKTGGDSRGSYSPRHNSGSNASRPSNSSSSHHQQQQHHHHHHHHQSGRESPISWRQANALGIRGLTQAAGPQYQLARLSPPRGASSASLHGQLSGLPQNPYTMHSIQAASPQPDIFQPPPQRPGPLPQYVQLPQAPPLSFHLQQQQQQHQVHLQPMQPASQQLPLQLQLQLPPSIQPQHLAPALQPNQNLPQHQQVDQPAPIPQQASWMLSASPAQLVQSLLGPSALQAPAGSWTEHVSPEGYKYYYNSVTRESKWEKPDELLKEQVLPPPPPPPELSFVASGNSVDQLRQQVWI